MIQKPDALDNKNRHIPHGFREIIQFYLIDSNTALGKFFASIESIVVIFFIVEYCARLYSARNRVKHLFNIFNIIDFIAILPTSLTSLYWSGTYRNAQIASNVSCISRSQILTVL